MGSCVESSILGNTQNAQASRPTHRYQHHHCRSTTPSTMNHLNTNFDPDSFLDSERQICTHVDTSILHHPKLGNHFCLNLQFSILRTWTSSQTLPTTFQPCSIPIDPQVRLNLSAQTPWLPPTTTALPLCNVSILVCTASRPPRQGLTRLRSKNRWQDNSNSNDPQARSRFLALRLQSLNQPRILLSKRAYPRF